MSDFQLDLTDVEPERIGNRSSKFPVGSFHVQVNSFTAYGGTNHDKTIVQLQCLASSVQGVEGMTHDEFFQNNVIAKQNLLALAIACRLTTTEEIKEMKKKKGGTNLDWQSLEGRQCLITTKVGEDKNDPTKKYINIDQIFDVADERGKSIPKNPTFLNRFVSGYPLKQSPSNGQPAAAASTSQPATAEASFHDDDMFA